MTRFGTMTAACLAVALAATSPALARGGHGGWHGGGGGYHGYRALEGTFLGGCLYTGRRAGRAAAAAIG